MRGPGGGNRRRRAAVVANSPHRTSRTHTSLWSRLLLRPTSVPPTAPARASRSPRQRVWGEPEPAATTAQTVADPGTASVTQGFPTPHPANEPVPSGPFESVSPRSPGCGGSVGASDDPVAAGGEG